MKANIITLNMVSKVAVQAALSATLIVAVLFATFMVAEPRISHGQSDTATFRVRQTITDETSFLVDPVNVTMSASISGITGGVASGSSRFVVKSNNASGYYVNIAFFDNAGPYAMLGDEDGGTQLRDYGTGVSEPQYNFTASTAAQFAYTVNSSTTLDTDQSFLSDGSANCNTGSTQNLSKCWKSPATSAFRIIDRDSSASTGATSTIYFKVHVPSGANPVPTAQTYTATATLSLFTQ
jgi:hypothetical protein